MNSEDEPGIVLPDAGTVRIGVSGWTYPPWRGVFYPDKVAQKNELAYAAGIFSSIEINGTFYSLQMPSSFGAWDSATPDDFVFSIKGPRYITHILRLRDAQKPIANFFAQGVLHLGAKLGPILWQLPPNFKWNAAQLEEFFALLPRDTAAASEMAKEHADRIKGPGALAAKTNAPLRYAVEIRNETFRTPDFVALLRKYNIAVCCADTVEWPRMMDVTSDFMYLRLHGEGERYVSGYDAASLDTWSARIREWAAGREPADAERAGDAAAASAPRNVFAYFDNDVKVRAPYDAQHLMARLRDLMPPTRRDPRPIEMAAPPTDLVPAQTEEKPRSRPPAQSRRAAPKSPKSKPAES